MSDARPFPPDTKWIQPHGIAKAKRLAGEDGETVIAGSLRGDCDDPTGGGYTINILSRVPAEARELARTYLGWAIGGRC